MLGRLQWLASLAQSGRTHMQTLWDVFSGRAQVDENRLRRDAAWWRRRLSLSAAGKDTVVPMAQLFTRQALETDAVVVATDAGDLGAGAVYTAPGA